MAVEVHLVNPNRSDLETFFAQQVERAPRVPRALSVPHAEKIQCFLSAFFFCGNSGHMCPISLGLVAKYIGSSHTVDYH